ncbi:MAG: DUF2892 domain-containing protein [Asticcacaulis sp.]
MFYAKNLPGLERLIRIMMGIGVAVAGLWFFQAQIMGYIIAGMGIMLAMTGMFGFCPMCAMAGRKLDKRNHKD